MYKNIFTHVSLFIIGAVSGILLNRMFFSPRLSEAQDYPVREKGYTFISPLLRYEGHLVNTDTFTTKLKDKITALTEQNIQKGLATDISVYFRTPDDGKWFVINSDTQYEPASLLKVGIAMAYYKIAETYPDVFSQQIPFTGPNNKAYNFPPKEFLIPGQEYTVEELVNRMLRSSDNDALQLLLQKSDDTVFKNFFDDIQIGINGPISQINSMTVRNYASIFRTLYNASYLSHKASVKLLGTMTTSEFKQGIEAGVSHGVIVSHKFGERSEIDSSQKQLHDCGIVYIPGKPFIVCIMTRGENFDSLQLIIQSLTAVLYKEVVNKQ